MYKLLLAWRYLRTRYIALASIISVTLGVATLIIVNSVMAGFTHEMQKRLNGILSDIVFESHDLNGFRNAQWHEREIRKIVGDQLQGITATVHVPAMLNFRFRGKYVTRQINLIGVDEATYADVSDFGHYLLHPDNRRKLSFLLRDTGYAPEKGNNFPPSGWHYRRLKGMFAEQPAGGGDPLSLSSETPAPGDSQRLAADLAGPPTDPYRKLAGDATPAPAASDDQQHTGVILGIAICSVRHRDADNQVKDYYLCRPGDDVQIVLPNSGSPPSPIHDTFTVVDLYESKMSEYDASFAFVPLNKLQELRGMFDPQSGIRSVTSIQLKLKPGADLNAVRDKLRARFPVEIYPYRIQTWRDMQGPLLAAVQLETTILNILLFLIIAVAGFGILATFFMIVVEKTRDIGVLKALGAPHAGVMSIFLSYGFSLGLVGSGAGMILGLLFVRYLNEIASGLEWVTGREVFDPTVYYFQHIPAIIEPLTVILVVLGAVAIAVLASVLPALRAARLHPVEALRYE